MGLLDIFKFFPSEYPSKYPSLKEVPDIVRQRKATGGPELLLQGKATSEYVADVLPTAKLVIVPSSLGNIVLQPGSIWSSNRMLIFSQGSGFSPVYYTIGDKLYKWRTDKFMTDEWINAISLGASRAMPMVTLAKAEIALLSGIFVPWYGMLGLSVAKIGLFYTKNKTQMDTALAQAPLIIEQFLYFKENYPTFFKMLTKTVARDLLYNLPSGVTLETVAFFIGRVLRGIGGLPQITLGAILRVTGIVAAIVTATHLPSIAAHSFEESVRTLQKRLAESGISISEDEARAILQELLSKLDSATKLQQVEQSLRGFIPIMDQLRNSIYLL